MSENGPENTPHAAIFGRPGSGKSSLAEQVGANRGYTLIRTGELLRAAVRRRDPLGLRVEAHMAAGEFVPDALVADLLAAVLASASSCPLLFDGFPRNLGQIPLLEDFERRLGFHVGRYLNIDVGREEAVQRMSGRRVCPRCGATYHVRNQPPRLPEICDLDGAPLQSRPDDRREVIELRQRLYDQNTAPILAYLAANFPREFREINGERSPEDVLAEALQALDSPTGARPVA